MTAIMLIGICTFANPGVLPRVAEQRGMDAEPSRMIALADCARLGDRVYLEVGGRVVGPLLSVDCGQAKHRQAQRARRLVADVPFELWQELRLPRAPVPCEVREVGRRPEGKGAIP